MKDVAVPPVLLGGHHAEIVKWRRQQALEATAKKRPDLILQGARGWLADARPMNNIYAVCSCSVEQSGWSGCVFNPILYWAFSGDCAARQQDGFWS